MEKKLKKLSIEFVFSCVQVYNQYRFYNFITQEMSGKLCPLRESASRFSILLYQGQNKKCSMFVI